MTKQEIFDEFYQHFVVEKHKRNVSGNYCVYRAPGCAIGCLKAFQKIYSDGMDGPNCSTPIQYLIDRIPAVRDLFKGVSFYFLDDLQDLHDIPVNWTKRGTLRKRKVKEFAECWDVDIPQ